MHCLPSTCKGRRMPVERELIDLTHATLLSICRKKANLQPQIIGRKLTRNNDATNYEKYNAFI